MISGKANRSAMMNPRIISHGHTMIQGRSKQGRGEQRPCYAHDPAAYGASTTRRRSASAVVTARRLMAARLWAKV